MAISSPLEKSLTVPNDTIWRLSVEQYHHMIREGILTDDDPVELLEGWLVTKMPKKPHHSLVTQLTGDALTRLLPAGWFVNIQEPITTAYSEPEPDVVLVRGTRRDYTERHPYPGDIALLVEVADATLHRDRTLKLRLYAAARIAIYWLVNLPDRQLEVYSEPFGTGDQAQYQQSVIYKEADTVPVIIEGREIARLVVHTLLA